MNNMSPKQSNSLQSSTSLRKITLPIVVGAVAIASSIFLLNDGSGGTIEVTGKDGAGIISTADSVVNQYTALSADVTAGSLSLTVSDINDLDNGSSLANGDLVLISQAQGASIKVTNDSTFGEVTDYHESGNYEFIFVDEVAGNTILFQSALQNDYTTGGKTQVIRVPQYSTLNIQGSSSITGSAWDGTKGGIVAFTASDTVTINATGSVDVSALGFRGGEWHNGTSYNEGTYYSNASSAGAQKGEGIAGSTTDYQAAGYLYARGAVANGGGGGNAHNAGGGGGANGNNGNTWTGQGVMCAGCTGSGAWALDEEYIEAGGFTNSSGGGRGGYSFGSSNKDALTVSPGSASWNGDDRQEVGGMGGRSVSSDGDEKLFLGGGGGAGDSNNGGGGDGGNGGGLVFIIAEAVKGDGSILANGEAGDDTGAGHNDAPGGGGAGGTVIIKANSATGVTIEAEGGEGGSQLITNNESEGPGGGGGGGFISVPAGATVTTSVAGGSCGLTSSASLTEFPANGSTDGASGEVTTTIYIHYPQSSTTFPVEWMDVTGEWQGENAVIQWVTASESNSDYFALERSADGRRFQEIQRIEAAGFSEEMIAYELTDMQAATLETDVLTYRLRQVDQDGKFDMSPSVELSLNDGEFPFQISTYPNPVTESFTLSVKATEPQTVSWTIYSLTGQKLMQGSVESHGGTSSSQVSLAALPAGRYILTSRGKYTGQSLRIVKQ